MEFIGASSAGTMRIYVYIFLDKSGQTSVDIHYFIVTALFRMIFLPALAGVCIKAPKPRGDWSPLHKINNKNETELSKHVRTLINANRLFKIYSIILRKCQPYT